MAYTLIHNGTLIDGNGGAPVADGAVLVEDHVIRAVGRVDTIQMFHQQGKGALEDIGALVVVEAGAAWNGIDKALVAVDQALPRGGVATAAGDHQGGVVTFVVAFSGRIDHLRYVFQWRASSCAMLLAIAIVLYIHRRGP